MGMVFSRGQPSYFVPAPHWNRGPRSLTLRDDPRGLYRYDPEFDELRLSKKGPYSFWSSVKYTLLLSVMLWWIPTFGQMIAGYVGGRKAGNHWKGAVAAFFPVAVIWTLSLLVIATNEFPQLVNLFTLPAAAFLGLGQAIPLIEPYVVFLVEYVVNFVIALRETAVMGLNGYLVTIVFAYIGGLIADQVARERAQDREPSEPAAVPPGYEMGYVRVAAAAPRPQVVSAGGPPWYRVHRERYDQFRRLPPAPYPYEEEEYYEPPAAYAPRPAPRRAPGPPRPPYPEGYREPAYREEYREPAYREPAYREPYGREEGYDEAPRREPPAEGRRTEGRRHLDREELIRRLVERALRDYDTALR